MSESGTFWAVLGISVTTAFIHTLTGPDHYLPFIVLAKSRKWSLKKTLGLTFVSGLGHILSAVILAVVFHYFSQRLSEWTHDGLNETRGSLAAWMLTVLGSIYILWGLVRLFRKDRHPHTHPHIHEDGTVHSHPHEGTQSHIHLHGDDDHRLLLVWSLFIIFVLGPCEALLPILAAASAVNVTCLYCSTLLFSAATILAMMSAVTVGFYGLRRLSSPLIERYSHVIAGLMIALCGIGMIFFGL